MSRERSDLGFSDALQDFNPEDWTPKTQLKARVRPPKAETREAAAAAGFHSREPETLSGGGDAPKAPRRRRTGRNQQMNLKAKPETIEAFTAIADLHGWGLGETLEKAVELLRREYS